MIGKAGVWKEVTEWFDNVRKGEREVPALRIEGEPTSGIGFMIHALGAEASIAHALVVRLGSKRDMGWLVGDALGDVGAAYQTLLRSLQGPCALVCVEPGGTVTARVSTAPAGAFACALGGDDGRTLFVCLYTEQASQLADNAPPIGSVATLRVDVPTA